MSLLAEFVDHGREEAFTTLVRRHVDLVHSVALRHTTNPSQAEEITQAVFVILARKARSLRGGTILPGWLYHTARLTAANFERAEIRRAYREQEAFMRSTLGDDPNEPVWREVAPLLDEAMGALGAKDRDAVVLRFFENKTLRQVGEALGLEERAAQKRVDRALEKLRRVFARRGAHPTLAVIAGLLSAHSVSAAPTALAATISSTALKGSAVAGSTLTLVKGTLDTMIWMKAKTIAAIAAGVVILAGAAAVIHHREFHQMLTRFHAGAAGDKRSVQADSAAGSIAPDHDAREAKLQAEGSTWAVTAPPKPDAQKALDEQKALSEKKR